MRPEQVLGECTGGVAPAEFVRQAREEKVSMLEDWGAGVVTQKEAAG